MSFKVVPPLIITNFKAQLKYSQHSLRHREEDKEWSKCKGFRTKNYTKWICTEIFNQNSSDCTLDWSTEKFKNVHASPRN